MRHARTAKVLVDRFASGSWGRRPDEVVVEEPLEIRLDDHLVATTMRTPGHDYELAVGFCLGDGLLDGAAVTGVRYCGVAPASEFEFNVVTVETGGVAPVPTPRLGNVSSACGLCGSVAITELATRLRPLAGTARFGPEVLAAVIDDVGARQEMFGRTGGLHAAATFDVAGSVDLVREDIGRHNAVDKVVGRRCLDGRADAARYGLFVSGRASFEMVQKAWAAGFGTVVAVSAPSSLAVQTAAAAAITLVGFARAGDCNVYAGSLRARDADVREAGAAPDENRRAAPS
ncbi:MAG TPA: formate dehydrogenase accessory sulfurtransferase FdhD [Acidimicrobiaceae bacterium]|nr:formate dehydrogenase accessory sulfurtransferase FdhD [Acidimicrobiaceae bacterium]HCB38017.1 formate dehydrogenase accessory sulfurtransferase FdhD [Acidimicrobiaceae bacterium]